MSKSKARFLAELLSSDGKVIKTKSEASTIIVGDLPTIPNSKLANSSITINSSATSLGGSVTLTTANVAENTNLYYTDVRADARIVNAGSANWNTAYTTAGAALPKAGGTLTGNLSLGDNVKAQFGGSNDLAIYHDGSASYIDEQGTGDLRIKGTSMSLKTSDNETYALFTANGASTLYYDNSPTLATTSSGISVTGNVVADGLTVDGTGYSNATFTSSYVSGGFTTYNLGPSGALLGYIGNAYQLFSGSTSDFAVRAQSDLVFATGGNNQRQRLASNGDVSFYEDTGTTAKFFWDASAESLGIGCTPSYPLEVQYGGVGTVLRAGTAFVSIDSVGSAAAPSLIFNGDSNTGFWRAASDTLAVSTGGTERMRIDSAGTLLVGESANFIATSTTATGLAIIQDGRFTLSRSGTPMNIGRLGSDGSLIDLWRQGAAVGSIGVSSGSMYIEGNPATGKVGLTLFGSSIEPRDAGSASNGAVDLGATGSRFKDLYLSNKVYAAYIGASSDTDTSINFDTANTIKMFTGGVERMRIDSSGNVGIGVTASGVKLAVLATVADNLVARFENNHATGSYGISVKAGDDSGNYAADFANKSGTSIMRIRGDGNVGIGTTTPLAKLHIVDGNNNAQIGDLNGSSTMALQLADSGASPIQLEAHGTSLRINTSTTSGATPTVKMIVLANGNVGIGTSTPQKKFHVEHTAGASEGILISGASDTVGHTAGILLRAEGGEADSALRAKAGIFLERVAGSYGVGKLHIANRHNGDNVSATISDANITIYDGKVGIGTTTPQSKLELNLTSAVVSSAMNTNTVNDVQLIRAPFNASPHNTSGVGAKWGLRFVGRNDGTYDNTKSGAIYAVSEDTLGYNRSVGLAFHTSPNDAVNTERMRITSTGNVGIGTTNFITTGAKLQVKGTSASPGISGSNFTGSIFSVEGTSTVNISMGTTGASSYDGWIQVHDAGTGTNYDLLLNPIGGNVGIGTTAPTAPLEVFSGEIANGANKGIRIVSNGAVKKYSIRTGITGVENTSFAIHDDTASANRLVISTAGNVGIGTSTPGALLDLETPGNTADGSYYSTMTINNTGSSTYSGVRFDRSAVAKWRVGIMPDDKFQIAKLYNTVDDGAFVIDSGGDVGIGTSSPGGNKLNVTASSTALAASFLNSHADGYGMRVTTYSNATQYGFAVDSYGGGYSRDFTVGVDGNVNVLTGNLVIGTAGKGIDFSATSGSGTSELLDDYEEGDFSLVLSGTVTAGTNSVGSIGGRYTKVGRLVTCQIMVANTTLSGAAGVLKFSGLPFTPAGYANRGFRGVVSTYRQNLFSPDDGYFSPAIDVVHNSTAFYLIQTKDDGNWVNVLVDNQSGLYFEGSVSYFTND